MIGSNNTIREAIFNPKFKTYIFFIVLFFLFTSVIGIILIPIWILGLGQWLSGLYFKSLKCTLTEKQLLFSKGILFRIEKTIPLENIQDLSFWGGPILRSMGLTFIKVETAGGGQGQQHMMSIPGVERAEELKTMILDQRERVINDKHKGEGISSGASDCSILSDIRNELREIKTILKEKKTQ